MNNKKTLLAVSLAGIITGCGGSGGDSGSDTSALKAQIIDGYLVNAEVYVDRNGNKVADEDEKLEGTTNAEGYISLAESDKDYVLIARAVAGQTFDTDKGGTITASFELAAPAGAMVLNPYTTLAVIEDKTIDEVATELNINSALISGDYVKAKSGNEADEAKKAHLVARSLALKLEDNITQSASNISTIKTELADIQHHVDSEVNKGTDLDGIVIKDGNVADAPKTVQELLVGNTYDAIPTNSFYFTDEGVLQVTFTSDNVSWLDDNGVPAGSMPIKYAYSGYQTDDGHEEILFVGDDFYLSVTPQNDMTLMAISTLGINEGSYPQDTRIVNADFAGKTLYHFWDDSRTSSAQPSLSKFAFHNDGTVTVSERNAQGSWVEHAAVNWEVANAQLIMDVPEEAGKQFTWSFSTLQHDGLRIAYDDRWISLFFTENEDLATSLYLKWAALSK
ncbi:hypothetical protein EXA18_16180 [Vibrio cincinnatiensis]|uniref:hypothetical protein n=1 Tax=Vibrio cincinnatiensis TaxID=675 RepID=UPI001EE14504|nr:hypothetical protein [Vibrio cincinnatiensis]MCG3744975.1 hypothetical protein [Vibrio cincinnatiensis]